MWLGRRCDIGCKRKEADLVREGVGFPRDKLSKEEVEGF